MKTRLVFAALVACVLPSFAAEKLDRGLVAVQAPEQAVYVGWRLLESDAADVAFDLYRGTSAQGPWQKVNSSPLAQSSNFLDSKPGGARPYYKLSSARGQAPDSVTRCGEQGYVSVNLQGNYSAQKVGLADFDGDGALDYLVKQPNFNTDPYQRPGYWKKSEDTYKLEAYKSDGTFMWRYDMGWAIEEGIWYSPIVCFDLTGDGKAEVFCKAGEGDPREPTGHVQSGPEHLVMLDGMTGKTVKKLPWPSREGLDEYNYWSRNLMGVGYLDGKKPYLLVERGTYRLIKLQAYDSNLNMVWDWASTGKYESYRGQGMHGMHCADIDQDGKDEVVIGSAVIDDNGVPLWNTRKGHPDACYVADIDPSRPGLEIFYGIETGRQSNTVALVEAATGKQIWGNPEITVHVHGQAMVGDIVPEHSGMECYAGEAKGGSNYWLYTAGGKLLNHENLGELSPKAIFWLDGPTKAYVVNRGIYMYPRKEVGGVKGTIVAIADCMGDWREEIITAQEGEIRIYTTTYPATTRRVTLMQDRLYRTDVAMQTMGYFYPPQLGLKKKQATAP